MGGSERADCRAGVDERAVDRLGLAALPAQSGKVDGRGEMRVSSPSGSRRLRSTGGRFATALSGTGSRRSRGQNRAQRATCDVTSVRRSTSQMSRSPERTRRSTYTSYSVGCAGVWGVILLLGRRRLDAQTWNTLRVVCGGWWMGWTSATIARIGYPPPRQLAPAGEKRLRIISIVLVALGLSSAFRVLAAGKRSPGSTPAA